MLSQLNPLYVSLLFRFLYILIFYSTKLPIKRTKDPPFNSHTFSYILIQLTSFHSLEKVSYTYGKRNGIFQPHYSMRYNLRFLLPSTRHSHTFPPHTPTSFPNLLLQHVNIFALQIPPFITSSFNVPFINRLEQPSVLPPFYLILFPYPISSSSSCYCPAHT